MSSINWGALLLVACVTIGATVAIASLMSLSNWCLTPAEGSEHPTVTRRSLGIILLIMQVGIILFGLYLMIPYFR